MKKTVVISGIVLLVALLAVQGFAWGPRGGRGGQMMGDWGNSPGKSWQDNRGIGNLTQEQQVKLNELNQKFFNDTFMLRNDIRVKSFDLNTALNGENPDVDKAKALQKEISDLRASLDQKRIDHQLEVQKIAPDNQFSRGYGRGRGGHMGGGFR